MGVRAKTRRRYSTKYGNCRVEVDGIKFDSKGEGKRWLDLQLLATDGRITGLERQVRFPLEVDGQRSGCYVADFVYFRGSERIVEDVKGMKTPLYKWKSKHFAAQYGREISEYIVRK